MTALRETWAPTLYCALILVGVALSAGVIR